MKTQRKATTSSTTNKEIQKHPTRVKNKKVKKSYDEILFEMMIGDTEINDKK